MHPERVLRTKLIDQEQRILFRFEHHAPNLCQVVSKGGLVIADAVTRVDSRHDAGERA